MVFDGVVDGRGGEEGVETAATGGGIVLGEDGVNDRPLGDGFAGFGRGYFVFLAKKPASRRGKSGWWKRPRSSSRSWKPP